MSVHPFDLKTILLAKHAQHVVLIHFPIALFIVGVAFDITARWTKSRSLADAAYFNFWVAAISTLPVVATGLLAWQWALEGQRLKGVLLWHMALGLISTVLIWIVVLIHRKSRLQFAAIPPKLALLMETLGVVAVALTGHLGGFLSGVNTSI